MFLKLITALERWDFYIGLPKKEPLSTRVLGEPGVDKKNHEIDGSYRKNVINFANYD
jgi:hypothetical protein